MVLFLAKDNSYLTWSGTDIQQNIYYQVAKCKKSFKSQIFSFRQVKAIKKNIWKVHW